MGKYVRFLGKSAHAGSSPHRGVNALQAALVALHALNTQRETFQDPDVVRVHGIIAHGGEAANATPAEVRYEGRVRGRSIDVVDDVASKMDRCLRAGALALGAAVEIVTIPGYFPLRNDPELASVFRGNAERLVGASSFTSQAANLPRGGSTDMGDLSQIMPVIHPYTGGCSGHGTRRRLPRYRLRPSRREAGKGHRHDRHRPPHQRSRSGQEGHRKLPSPHDQRELPRPPGLPDVGRVVHRIAGTVIPANACPVPRHGSRTIPTTQCLGSVDISRHSRFRENDDLSGAP